MTSSLSGYEKHVTLSQDSVPVTKSEHGPSLTKRASMQALVDEILGCLSSADIPYCLLRNRAQVPEGLLAWSDLDVLVPATVSSQELITIFATLRPTQIVQVRNGRLTFYFPKDELFLRVDILIGDAEWRGVPFVDHKAILAHRWNDNGIMVASVLHQSYVVWFTKILWNGTLPQHYEPLIAGVMQAQPVALRSLLEKAFGPGLAGQLAHLAQTDRVGESVALATACRRALWLRALRRNPLKTLSEGMGQLRDAVEQRLRPTGLDVAILGAPGAGKSSVCSIIASSPSRKVAFGATMYQPHYHRVLPPLSEVQSRLLRRPMKPTEDPLDPFGRSPHNPFGWLLNCGYYGLDQWLSEVLWTRGKLAHMSLILRDRHVMEIFIDQQRYHFTGPKRLARWLVRLAPKPDLVLVLDAPPDVLQTRKQEVPLKEIARQRQAYWALAEHLPNGRIVDASQPLDKVTSDVIAIITEHATARTRSRFNLKRLPEK